MYISMKEDVVMERKGVCPHCIHAYIHTNIDIHTYIPTYIHTYIHTYIEGGGGW